MIAHYRLGRVMVTLNQSARLPRFILTVWLCGFPLLTEAVLFEAMSDPNFNTNAPAGLLAVSGWQYQGKFGDFLGTAIAPHFFLTARHIGGGTNTPFIYGGSNYFPIAYFDDPAPGSDLRLWQIAGQLSSYAPFYTGSNEVGASIMVMGRGTQRGSEVITVGLTNGWLWGAGDAVIRWGVNQVEAIRSVNGAPYLYATFTHNAGSNECALSTGDSGGAAFIEEDGVWQLAGIHYSVDGHFNTTNTGDGFDASLYDAYGLYIGKSPNWTLITNHVASGFYSSQVPAHYSWITNVIPDFDSNANGLPDWWEQLYSGSLHGLVATNDNDSDGLDNYAEWIAQTDPTNAASVFRIEAIAETNGTVALIFQGWSNRLYAINACSSLLVTGNWTQVTVTPLSGTNGPAVWIDTNILNSTTTRFYRLDVTLP